MLQDYSCSSLMGTRIKILFMYLFFSNHKKGWHPGRSRTSDPGDRPKGLRGPLRLAPKIRRRLFCPYIKMAPTVETSKPRLKTYF